MTDTQLIKTFNELDIDRPQDPRALVRYMVLLISLTKQIPTLYICQSNFYITLISQVYHE